MVTLDILVPHFNDPEGLELSARSIIRQKWVGEKRIVIVDDGSSLESRRSLEAIVENIRHQSTTERPIVVELQHNSENRGRPYTRNALLDSISSQYVSWLDAGDEWYPQKINKQFEVLDNVDTTQPTRPVWVTCNYDWAWSGGSRRKITQRTEQDQHKALLMGKSLRGYLWTLLGSSNAFKCVGWFDERLPRMQDLDFFLRFISHGGIIRNTTEDGALCVYHKSDIGRDADEIRECNSLIFNKHRILYNRYGVGFKKMRLYDMEMLAARFAQNNQDRSRTRHYLWQAFKHKPLVFLNHVGKKGLRP